MSATEDRNEPSSSLIDPEVRVFSSNGSRKHGEDISGNPSDTAINFGEDGLVESGQHDRKTMQLIQIKFVVLKFLQISAPREGLPPVLDPHILYGMVMMVAVEETEELIGTLLGDVLSDEGVTLLLSGLLRVMAPSLVSLNPTRGYCISA